MLQTHHGLPGNHSDADEKHDGVGQRRHDRGTTETVGPLLRRTSSRQPSRYPSQHETGNVGEVVPGVGQQGERVDGKAIESLDADERQVECDADRESAVIVGRRVVMAV